MRYAMVWSTSAARNSYAFEFDLLYLRIDSNSQIKIGLSPTILKVFIKGNLLANDIEKILELYSKDDKTQSKADRGRNPMMDYLEKIYSFRNYDLLRPYRSIFRGLKTLGKHDHTTQSSWLKSLQRRKYLTDDYWELNQPVEVTKIPYHRLREKSRIERLNKLAKSSPSSTLATTTSSGTNGTNSTQSPNHKKHHFKSPFDVLGRKEFSTPPSLRFCEKPCDALEEDEAKLAPKPSTTSGPQEEETTPSSGDGCDEDYQDVEVFAHQDSTDVINIPFNKHSYESALKAATPTARPRTTNHKNTKPPKLKVFTGTANPLIWTLPPHPILDKYDNADIISTRLQSGGGNGTPQPPVSSAVTVSGTALPITTPSTTCASTDSSPTRPPFCITRRRKPQKIIVRISSSLGEVPVVIMRDNRTCGVSLSLVNDFILDEKNNLFKKVNHRNTLLTIKSKFHFNQSKALPEIKISRKTSRNRHPLVPLPMVRPQSLMQSPLFALPPRPYPFQMEPLNPLPRIYGFPETRVGPQAYPQPYSLGLRPPFLPLYFSSGGLQPPIPPPRQRFGMKVE